MSHIPSTDIAKEEFEDKWKILSSALVALGLDQHEVERLKTEPIDNAYTERLFLERSSCLPDEFPDVFGREKEIRQVTEDIQSGAVAGVVIIGGPGFGKTTVAKEVSHQLDKAENDRTVLFCSLRSKKTFDEVAIEMILRCGEIHPQLPSNPEQKLKQWSRQLKDVKLVQKQVTFVLDNADDLLESKDRQKFESILKEMRSLSGQKVTFVITSRRTFFSDPDLQMKERRLESLSDEDARKVLTSRVSDPDILKTLTKTDQLVKLCGGVPLAHHIVGRHLSYIKEDTLIKSLEEKPLDVLEEGELSVEKAVEISFDLLTKLEQEALAILSLFPGSFHSDAAKAVIKVTTDAEADQDPILIFLSLVKGPLVENSGLYRYKIHPLIHHFLTKIAQSDSSRYHHLLDRGRKLACAHFMSRFDKNATMYWSKDKCKESIEAFNEDRQNFEYFLQIFAQGRETQDQETVDTCRTFIEDLPQKCMYLEMCVLPRFYTEILESLLKTFSLDSQPVHRVELLCLLGHESRKKGDQQKYKQLMEEADRIHSENSAEFKTNPLSEVYFCNSYARFLSSAMKDVRKNKRRQKEIGTSQEVCLAKLGDHPQTAVTLKRAGMFAKDRKDRVEAERLLKEALELFQKCLGKHLLTAMCFKDLADLYFADWRKKELDICLNHYEEAIAMFEDLGMGGSKETILTLKNFAICHRRKGKLDEATELLTKAEKIAERELEVDHKLRALIKTELASLHSEMGN